LVMRWEFWRQPLASHRLTSLDYLRASTAVTPRRPASWQAAWHIPAWCQNPPTRRFQNEQYLELARAAAWLLAAQHGRVWAENCPDGGSALGVPLIGQRSHASRITVICFLERQRRRRRYLHRLDPGHRVCAHPVARDAEMKGALQPFLLPLFRDEAVRPCRGTASARLAIGPFLSLFVFHRRPFSPTVVAQATCYHVIHSLNGV
jgi:hypothetical protein